MRKLNPAIQVIYSQNFFCVANKIDKIKDVSRRAAEVGGVGDRYLCVIDGQESKLWFEKGRWFVEAKV